MSAHVEGLLILVRADIVQHLRNLGLPCAAHVAEVAERATEWSDVAEEVNLVCGGRTATIARRAADRLSRGNVPGAAEILRTIHGETAAEWETRVRALVPPGT